MARKRKRASYHEDLLNDFNINNNDCAVGSDMLTFMNESVTALVGVVGTEVHPTPPPRKSRSEGKNRDIGKLWLDEVTTTGVSTRETLTRYLSY